MKFRITLFLIISGIFIPLNSANATSTDRDRYFFHTGSVSSICSAYVIDAVSKKDASMMLNSLIETANKQLKDSKKIFNNFVKNGKTFTENGCSKLLK